MFKVDVSTKKLEKLNVASFKDIRCSERQDLQQWIISDPFVLGEELLIIQEEFSKFESTNERIDLLALDKDGRIVVIENKTDDTGRDVVWQAVKYASYCSTMTSQDICTIFAEYINKKNIDIDAEQTILDFYNKDSFDELKLNEGNSQRIIMVSKSFRPEVLSAAKWLADFGIGVSCVQLRLLCYKDEIFLDAEQILPQKEMQDYSIKIANKEKDLQQKAKALIKSERLRSAFWEILIPAYNEKSDVFKNISYLGRKDHWLGAASGIGGGIQYNFLICKKYCGVELGIASSDREHNKKIFDMLFDKKQEIESKLVEYKVEWERLNTACMSRVVVRNYELSLYNENSWEQIKEYLINLMNSFVTAMKPYAINLKKIK